MREEKKIIKESNWKEKNKRMNKQKRNKIK